jgi:hypothetical protein
MATTIYKHICRTQLMDYLISLPPEKSLQQSVMHLCSRYETISDDESREVRRIEAESFQHYTELEAFLNVHCQERTLPTKVREKLLRLSTIQFHELSSDVFDEVQRRQASMPLAGRPLLQEKAPPFLQPRPDYHEKRNQARQKMAALRTPRFYDLCTDVFCEMKRRYPQFAKPTAAQYLLLIWRWACCW